MRPPGSSTVVLLVLLPLIVWRVYRRFRRAFGRQRLSKIRPWITLAVYSVLIVLLCSTARAHPERLWWLAGGFGAGSLLGLFGLKKTRFEPTPKGLFYTPHAHLGIALSLLFVGRIAYRFVEIYGIENTAQPAQDEFAHSPATLAVFGLMAGYYIIYAIGLVRWRARVIRARRRREANKNTNCAN